jgi:catechol 2,3-dioxygenase-like lactoylglutathione lyase family enzyme
MQIVGTHHIAIRTDNFAAMREFYEHTLGLPFVGGFPGMNIIFLSLVDTTIELIETTGSDPSHTMGFHHLAMQVNDVDATYAELAAKGITFHMLPRLFPDDAPKVRIAFFKDPDGNELEIIQPLGSKYPKQA